MGQDGKYEEKVWMWLTVSVQSLVAVFQPDDVDLVAFDCRDQVAALHNSLAGRSLRGATVADVGLA